MRSRVRGGAAVRVLATVGVLAAGESAAAQPASAPGPGKPAWPSRRAHLALELDSSAAPFRVFALEGGWLRVRAERGRFRVAVFRNGWTDEASLSRGLPPVRVPRGSSRGQPGPEVCNRVDRVFGRFPAAMWLVENGGGSMVCGASWGEYRVWHYRGGAWQLSAARSPKLGEEGRAGGILATWPLGDGVLGLGVSNLVGDPLRRPLDVLWTRGPKDPWTTRRSLRGAACAGPDGTVYAFDGSSVVGLRANGRRERHALPAGDDVAEPACEATARALFVIDEGGRTLFVRDLVRPAWSRHAVPWTGTVKKLAWSAATRSLVVIVHLDGEQRSRLLLGGLETAAGVGWTEVTWDQGLGSFAELVTTDDRGVVMLTWSEPRRRWLLLRVQP